MYFCDVLKIQNNFRTLKMAMVCVLILEIQLQT